MLAMVGVGLFAAMLGRAGSVGAAVSFVGMMLVGGTLGITGIEVPAVEIGIAIPSSLSVPS